MVVDWRRCEETAWDDGNIYNLIVVVFTGCIYTYPNSLNHILKIWTFHFVNILFQWKRKYMSSDGQVWRHILSHASQKQLTSKFLKCTYFFFLSE